MGINYPTSPIKSLNNHNDDPRKRKEKKTYYIQIYNTYRCKALTSHHHLIKKILLFSVRPEQDRRSALQNFYTYIHNNDHNFSWYCTLHMYVWYVCMMDLSNIICIHMYIHNLWTYVHDKIMDASSFLFPKLTIQWRYVCMWFCQKWIS